MSPPTPDSGGDGIARLFGFLLMAVGGLITLLSGLCSLGFLLATIESVVRAPASVAPMIGLILVFGGVPLAVGVGLFVLGRSLTRPRRENPSEHF
jgi:hypothetical protein